MKIISLFFLLSVESETAENKSDSKPTVKTSVTRTNEKAKTAQARADEAFQYGSEDDIVHSIEELTMDSLLQSLFPGNKIFYLQYSSVLKDWACGCSS